MPYTMAPCGNASQCYKKASTLALVKGGIPSSFTRKYPCLPYGVFYHIFNPILLTGCSLYHGNKPCWKAWILLGRHVAPRSLLLLSLLDPWHLPVSLGRCLSPIWTCEGTPFVMSLAIWGQFFLKHPRSLLPSSGPTFRQRFFYWALISV